MVKPLSQNLNLDDIASFTLSGACGDFVYREGDPGKDMFIIQEGQIEILNQYAGESRQLDVLEVGDFFGELSLLEDQRRDASARAVTEYRLLRIDRTTLHQLVQENPEIAVRMLHRLASRLREHEEARLRASEIAAGAMKPLLSPTPAPGSGDAITPSAQDGAAKPGTVEAAATSQPPALEPAPAAASRAATLVHTASGEEFPLAETGELTVGRVDRATGFKPQVDLTALDTKRTLSRRHAKILKHDDAFHLREETATGNGTFVNGTRVTTGVEVKLNHGDRVRFGLVETEFRCR